jgi:hypothetical protein
MKEMSVAQAAFTRAVQCSALGADTEIDVWFAGCKACVAATSGIATGPLPMVTAGGDVNGLSVAAVALAVVMTAAPRQVRPASPNIRQHRRPIADRSGLVAWTRRRVLAGRRIPRCEIMAGLSSGR